MTRLVAAMVLVCAICLSGVSVVAPVTAQTGDHSAKEQACELRYTEIMLNRLGGPASREVSEAELRWADEQTSRKERGEACVLPMSSPESAEDGAGDADRHNAAFETGLQWRVTPQTTDERLICAAVWNRWNYAVESAASESFLDALRPELSVANAGTREAFWRAEAARLLDSASDVFALGEEEAAAEQKADALYAAYVQGEARGLGKLMEWLAICK